MSLAAIVKDVCSRMGVPIAELSRRVGQSPQNLGKKLNNETLNYEEFQNILEVLGVRYEYSLTLPGEEPHRDSVDEGRNKEKIALLEARLELEKKNLQFQKNLCRDIRTELYTITGNSAAILKQINETDKIRSCIGNIQTAETRIDMLLAEALGLASASATAADNGTADPALFRGKRILLVDDNEMNREITRDILEDNGFIVEEAEDGDKAVEKVAENPARYYSCVLMDIQMPRMDGMEATRRIRELPGRVVANVPIIAMTANAFEEDRKKSLECGMDAYLIKPVNAPSLMAAVSSFI